MIKLTCPKSTLRDRGTRWNLKFSHQAVESRVKIITRLSLTLRQISSRGHGKGWYIRNRYLFLSRNRKYKISNNKSGRFSWTQLTISQFSKQEKTIHGNSRKKGSKGGSRHKNWCMAWVLNFLIRYFSNYYILHRSDLAAWAAPLDPRLLFLVYISNM